MHMVLSFLVFYITQTIAKAVPSNLAAFLNKIKADGACNDPFPGSFYDKEGGSKCMYFEVFNEGQTFALTASSVPLLQRRRLHLPERTERQTGQHGH